MKIVELKAENIEQYISDVRAEISIPDEKVVSTVTEIVEGVRTGGDNALFAYTKRFDNFDVTQGSLTVTSEEVEWAYSQVSEDIKRDLKIAAKRVRLFHEKKVPTENLFTDDLGNELGWLVNPIEKAGLYVPGGKAAYPSTVLMTAIPARVAGVEELYLTTPCPNGNINPSVIVAADIANVDKIYKVGGAQAVAALAYGTESVSKVDKIVGPGNIYVALAKRQVFGAVDIDMIAGPSEVLVIADGSCPAAWVAADLLAQAEHDELAVPILVSTSLRFAEEVRVALFDQLAGLSRKAIAGEAVRNQGRIFVVKDVADAVRVANFMAPEHLEICIENPKSVLRQIKHAGAIFLGSLSTEAFGDYVAGPSHVLPTGGTARFSSPLSVYDFLRMPSVISFTKKGFDELSGTVMNLADCEGLEAHALSVKVRL